MMLNAWGWFSWKNEHNRRRTTAAGCIPKKQQEKRIQQNCFPKKSVAGATPVRCQTRTLEHLATTAQISWFSLVCTGSSCVAWINLETVSLTCVYVCGTCVASKKTRGDERKDERRARRRISTWSLPPPMTMTRMEPAAGRGQTPTACSSAAVGWEM